MKKTKTIFMFVLMLILIINNPINVYANDTKISDEIIGRNNEDWIVENHARPTQGCNYTFKATISFKPTNVVAKANRNSITVTADLNPSVRVILIEYSKDRRFWWSNVQPPYRNYKYNKCPIMVSNTHQQKYHYDKKKYSSSCHLTITQGKRVLYDKSVYHPNDQWGYVEANQEVVDTVRNKIKFRNSFQIKKVYDCHDGYWVKITYIYTSGINGRNLISESVIAKVK